MADSNSNSKIDNMREWIVEHKLHSVGCLWLSGIVGSITYNWSQPDMKTSVGIIHTSFYPIPRKNEALTLAALARAAVVEYYDHKSGAKSERYAKFLDPNSHKD
ncbi:hypothetical protein L6452_01692 [Arctium lappa]|uniref:Uncharacterized protein n=1 Tax=Arctium lappa TaxID=4217 RepID=A0ACB9FI62_ARCLA|nr:hypothetical protein L6452_01692 [Arctium lappa]